MSADYFAIAPCNIRKVKSRGVSIMEIEVPIEHHRLLTAYFDECVVRVNLEKGEVKQYGVFEKPNAAQSTPVELVVEEKSDSLAEEEIENKQDKENNIYKTTEADKVKRYTRGPMCMQCIYMMNNPEFMPWLISVYPETVNLYNGNIDEVVKNLLGVDSRKELDTNRFALERFKMLQTVFKKRVTHA